MPLFHTKGVVGKALSFSDCCFLELPCYLVFKTKGLAQVSLHRALENIQVIVRWHLHYTVIEHWLRAPE